MLYELLFFLSSSTPDGPRNTSVSVSPSGEIVEGSSVTLTCSSDANPPVYKYTWYKKNVASPKASEQSYSITNISSEDRGEYYCEAKNGRGSMNSTALMIIVAGKQTSVVTAAVGIIVVVLVLILCLSGLMWFRKKASTSTSNTRDTAEMDRETLVQCMTASQHGHDLYCRTDSSPQTTRMMFTTPASTSLVSKKPGSCHLYSTVQVPQPQKEDEGMSVRCSEIQPPSAATLPAQAAEEDPLFFISTVNKPTTKKT
nr:B-cell receptor CD22-like [Salvelinus alpinus]